MPGKTLGFIDFVDPNPAEALLSGGTAIPIKSGKSSPAETVFAALPALKGEQPFDFDAAVAETLARLDAVAPPGAIEWAAANRPDLTAAVEKAAALLDEAAADNDALVFELALGEYEAAWRAVFEAYEKAAGGGRPGRDGQAPAAVAAGDGEGFPCPGDTGEGYKNGGDVQTENINPTGAKTVSAVGGKTAAGGEKPSESSVENTGGYMMREVTGRKIPTVGDRPLVGQNKGRSGGPVGGDGQTPPNGMLPKAERRDETSLDPVQTALFPETGAAGEKDSRPAPPRLPFATEPAPTAWQEWLDRVKIVVVEDVETWRSALAAAKAAGVCGFDTETTGLDPFVNEIRLLQLAVPAYPAGKKNLVAEDGRGPEPGGGAVAYVADLWRFGEEDRREMLEGVAGLVADPDVSFAGHNLKFDLKFLRSALAAAEGKPRWPGKRFACERLFDTMLASQLVTAGDFIPEAQFPKWREEHGVHIVKEGNGPTRYYDRHGHEIKFERDTQKKIRPVYPTHSLKEIAHRHLEVVLDKEEQASDWSAPELTERQIRYAGLDAAVLLPLREILASLLYKNRMARVAQIEFSALPIVAEIEACGMPFNAEEAWKMEEAVKTAVESARIKLVELAREAGFRARPKKNDGKRYSPDLNPDSTVDVIDCLEILASREGLLIDTGEIGKSFRLPGGETLPLESRDNTLSMVSAILPDESGLKKFISLLKEYRATKKKADFLRAWIESLHPMTSRLHSDLRQLNPQATGRISASNPNLLQVGRDKDIRALFKAPEGRKLVICDFSAIEMRLMGELAGDQNMIQTFQEGADIHRRTAAAIAGKPEEEVTKAERQAAKACFSGDTEILTPSGWVKFKDYDGVTPVAQYILPDGLMYNPPRPRSNRWGLPTGKVSWDGSGGEIEFVAPLAFEKFEDREVWRQVDRNTDLVLTKDHEVIFLDGNLRPRKIAAEKVNPGNIKYVIAAGVYNTSSKLSEIAIRILAMVVADGSFNGKSIRFGFKKRRKIERCLTLLREAGIKFTNHTKEDGLVEVKIKDPDFYAILRQFLNENKELRWSCIHDLDGRIYLDEAKYWDGHVLSASKWERVLFCTTSRQTAEVMQAMAATNDIPAVMRARIPRRNNRSTEYILSYVLGKPPVWQVSWHPEPLPEKCTVFCVQVPSGAILVRRNGKVSVQGNCNFGIIYGISPESLKVYAETSYGVSMSLEEAALAREKFFKAYPGVARWHESQRRKSYENGFEIFFRHDALHGYYAEKRPCARTLAGRLRTWPVVKEKSRNGYGVYLRKAGPVTELYNFPDQGSGADLLKSALGNLYREFLARGWDDAYLVASVHDELVLELPEEKAGEGAALLKEVMEKAGEGFIKNVPIEAETGVGSSWADKA